MGNPVSTYASIVVILGFERGGFLLPSDSAAIQDMSCQERKHRYQNVERKKQERKSLNSKLKTEEYVQTPTAPDYSDCTRKACSVHCKVDVSYIH